MKHLLLRHTKKDTLLRVHCLYVVLCCWILGGGVALSNNAVAAVPIKKLEAMLNQLSPQTLPTIERYLNSSQITPQERAQLLQLKSLYQLSKMRSIEAKALYHRALELNPKVPLLGDMNAATRSKYRQWRAAFFQQHKRQRKPPPKKPTPMSPNKTPMRVLYISLMGLGIGGVVAGAITASMTSQAASDYTQLAVNDSYKKALDTYDQAQTLQTANILSFIFGGTLLTSGVIVMLITETTPPQAKPPSKNRK